MATVDSTTVNSTMSLSTTSLSSFLPIAQKDGFRWFSAIVGVTALLLLLEQTVYRSKKQHLPGDKWTIPIIGKFADSMNPTMDGYMKQWASGALSALSVFNM